MSTILVDDAAHWWVGRVAGMGVTAQGLSTAADLGRWVQRELSAAAPDRGHMLRVLLTETAQWFRYGLGADEVAHLAEEPASTGDERWNALIEGLVARQLHAHQMRAPEWTKRTKLAEPWAAYGHVVRDPEWGLIDVLGTPVELLDKGVILHRENLQVI